MKYKNGVAKDYSGGAGGGMMKKRGDEKLVLNLGYP